MNLDKPQIIEINAETFPGVEFQKLGSENYSVFGHYSDVTNHLPGIKVWPNLQVPEGFDGYIYISQFINNSIDYKFYDRLPLNFSSGGSVADGKCYNNYHIFRHDHGKKYNINPNKEDEIYFSDAPRQHLPTNLCELNYNADFKTYFQYSQGVNLFENLKQLCYFQWSVKFKAIKTNDQWTINNQDCADSEKVIKSFTRCDDEDGIDFREIEGIDYLYEEFRKKHFDS